MIFLYFVNIYFAVVLKQCVDAIFDIFFYKAFSEQSLITVLSILIFKPSIPPTQLPSSSTIAQYEGMTGRGGGGDLVSIMPVCVCSKVKEMGSFTASSE